MKILITTGIYPPKIGGPAEYAKNLKEAFEKLGYEATVKTFGIENYLPSGLRHLLFSFKMIPSAFFSDAVFAFDTFSTGLPSVLIARIFGRKCVIRTGGDFLWEQYIERTKKKVLLKNFYKAEKNNFSPKEKAIFAITKWTLLNASRVVFSTEWQRGIFADAYGLPKEKTSIIENFYGPKEFDFDFESKIFVGSARNIFLKNLDDLEKIFGKIKKNHKEANLFTKNLPFDEFTEKIKNCYAVIAVSISEVSPNIILDAIRFNRPFICTKEVGIYERIKEAGIFIDPLNEDEIEEAVLNLLDEENYKRAKEKVRKFKFLHLWDDIAGEFITILESL